MVACTSLSFGPLPLVNLGWVADNIVAELAAMMVISIALSLWLYDSSFRGKQKLLAVGGSSGKLNSFPLACMNGLLAAALISKGH